MIACRFHAFASVFLIPLTLPVLHADVTLRYKMEVRMNPALPAQMPAGASTAMASVKTDVSPARVTGRTAVIQGVETEEREIVISVNGPAIPNMPPGPMIRMVMQLWTAEPGEVLRVPAMAAMLQQSDALYMQVNQEAAASELIKGMFAKR